MLLVLRSIVYLYVINNSTTKFNIIQLNKHPKFIL